MKYLQAAVELNELTVKHFWDEKNGGFFMTADDGEKLLVRHKELYDGAIPSGNSVAALNLLRIARMTGKTEYTTKASELMQAFSLDIERRPSNYTQMLQALDFASGQSLEIVVAGDLGDPRTQKLLNLIHQQFIPNKVVIHRPNGDNHPITKIAPYTKGQTALKDGSPQVYICRNFVCKEPVSDHKALLAELNSIW